MKKNLIIIVGAVLGLMACQKNLDRFPTNDVTSATVYSTTDGYLKAAAKVYGAFALTGNEGPAGNKDVQGIDEGFSDFLRLFWKAQELSTDEAVIAWGDAGIQDFHNMNWSSSNDFLTGLYYRSMFQITLANDFIRQAADDKLSSRGITGADATKIVSFRNEARFLRAYQYWVLMDLYGNPPFVDETYQIGSGVLPKQIKRAELFTYVEKELKALESLLPNPKTNEYGRADKAAVWALLARLYLNAEVYTGTARWNDALTYSKKVIDAGYSLIPNYTNLMRADNNKNTSEFILTINYDGKKTQTWGGTTFLTHAAVGGSMPASAFGINGGWGGTRTTKALVKLFGDGDSRAQFYTQGQSLEITDQTKFTDGYAITKYKNITMAGTPGSDQTFTDIDFPIFRLAEQYLIYAEATKRGAGGDATLALNYINLLRTRAGAPTVSAVDLTPDFILDERARELYWEGFRRTDLIRYKKFTTSAYLWPWKGGASGGTSVADYRNLYPIPATDKNANTNLTQNPGY